MDADRIVTAHAVVRYAERVLGADLDKTRRALAASGAAPDRVDWLLMQVIEAAGYDVAAIRAHITRCAAAGAVLGAPRVIADGVIYVIEDARVVTVAPQRPRKCRDLSRKRGRGRPQPRRRNDMEAIHGE